MRSIVFGSLLSLALVATLPALAQNTPRPPPMELSITAFADGDHIPLPYTQAGEGVAPGEGTSPELSWTNVPEGTQSFVLHFHDMDVTRDNTTEDQVHWLVWNIPGTATGLPEGVERGASLPDGSFQTSVTGPVYRGPGAGANGPFHHYMFELYALDTTLDVQPVEDAFENRRNVMAAVQGHVIGKAVYGGLFRRPE